ALPPHSPLLHRPVAPSAPPLPAPNSRGIVAVSATDPRDPVMRGGRPRRAGRHLAGSSRSARHIREISSVGVGVGPGVAWAWGVAPPGRGARGRLGVGRGAAWAWVRTWGPGMDVARGPDARARGPDVARGRTWGPGRGRGARPDVARGGRRARGRRAIVGAGAAAAVTSRRCGWMRSGCWTSCRTW